MAAVYTVDKRISKEKIIEVADKLFRSGGLESVSARRVVAELGVTSMAMYRHLRNKDELIELLVDRGFSMWEERLAAAVAKPVPLGRLIAALKAYRQFAVDEPRFFDLMFLTRRPNVPAAPASLSTSPSPSFTRLIESVAECMRTGELVGADVPGTILMIWATAHGIIALHFTGRFGYDNDAFTATYDQTLSILLERLKL